MNSDPLYLWDIFRILCPILCQCKFKGHWIVCRDRSTGVGWFQNNAFGTAEKGFHAALYRRSPDGLHFSEKRQLFDIGFLFLIDSLYQIL